MIQEQQQPMHQLEMVNGTFKPSEARDMVQTYYKETINFYKIKQLKLWVENHNVSTSIYDQIIQGLLTQKNDLLKLISKAEEQNLMIQFKGKFDTKLVA